MCGSDQENVILQFTAAPVVLACPGPVFMIIINVIVCVRVCVCVFNQALEIFLFHSP